MSKPKPASRKYTIHGTKPASAERKRHLTLVPRERETRNEERFELRCIKCLAPREKRSFPLCGDCQTGGEAA